MPLSNLNMYPLFLFPSLRLPLIRNYKDSWTKWSKFRKSELKPAWFCPAGWHVNSGSGVPLSLFDVLRIRIREQSTCEISAPSQRIWKTPFSGHWYWYIYLLSFFSTHRTYVNQALLSSHITSVFYFCEGMSNRMTRFGNNIVKTVWALHRSGIHHWKALSLRNSTNYISK